MLDVHVLTTERLPKEWVTQCMESIEVAMDRSPVPVELYLTPESVGDFWGARWRGYSLGSQEWTTYIDLDDWVEPTLFTEVVPYLIDGVDSLQTKGYDYHPIYKRTYETDRGVRFHRRELVERANHTCTHVCCPSCHMFYNSDKRKVIDNRLATFRVGYGSLAEKWRRSNGVG